MIILIKKTIVEKLSLRYYIDIYIDLIASSILSLDVVPMMVCRWFVKALGQFQDHECSGSIRSIPAKFQKNNEAL